MPQPSQRAYPRITRQTPIQYGVINGGNSTQYHDTRTLNYSAGGFCYETGHPLALEAEVCIVMNNYTPGQTGPECFRSYLTRVCWIQPLASHRNARFVAGARIIARSHEILKIDAQEARHHCDLCSTLMSVCQLQCTDGNAQLCDACYKHFFSLPQGKIRECLERFLTGNVV